MRKIAKKYAKKAEEIQKYSINKEIENAQVIKYINF
jgi:hypothetical protein